MFSLQHPRQVVFLKAVLPVSAWYVFSSLTGTLPTLRFCKPHLMQATSPSILSSLIVMALEVKFVAGAAKWYAGTIDTNTF